MAENPIEKTHEAAPNEAGTKKPPKPKMRFAKLKAVQMRLEGKTYTEIAAHPEVQRHESTVRLWFWDDPSNPRYDPKCRKRLEQLEEDQMTQVRRTIKKAAKASVLTLIQIMKDTKAPAGARIAAALAIQDKAMPGEGGGNYYDLRTEDHSKHIQLESKTDAELIVEADAVVRGVRQIDTELKAITYRIAEDSAALAGAEENGADEAEGDRAGAESPEAVDSEGT
jgi:hypothetical protein